MKNLNKIICIAIILLFVIGTITVNASTATVTLKPNATTVSKGDTFTVTMAVSCADGINGITTKFTYDDTALELKSAAVEDSTKWMNMSSGVNADIMSNTSETIKDANVYVLTFLVKDTTTVGPTQIKATELSVDSDAATNSQVDLADQSTTITIKEKTTTTPDTNNPGNTPATDNQGTSDGEQAVEEIKKDNTVISSSKLPQTGANYIIYAVAGTVAVLAVVYFSFYKKYRGL